MFFYSNIRYIFVLSINLQYIMLSKKLKIYRCEFEGVWAAGNCLVLAAYNQEQAEEMARKTITHTAGIVVNELSLTEPQIIEYLSGDITKMLWAAMRNVGVVGK